MRSLIFLLSFACTGTEKTDTDLQGQVVSSDQDGDGFVGEEDCNDFEATINPGAEELCDNLDNNCNGEIDEGVTTTYYLDADNDGFGDPDVSEESCDSRERFVSNPNDCDDTRADVYPGAPELCDELDNDCNDEIDDELGNVWYEDADLDGYGNVDVMTTGCNPGVGYTDNALDCDDTSYLVSPSQVEVCDELDNNCDGVVDEGVTTTYYLDADGDGYGNSISSIEACGFPSGYTLDNTDCNDDEATVRPNGVEICDELDNNCDGVVDEGVLLSFYPDADFDGFGDSSQEVLACTAPLSHVSDNSDCNDAVSTINPDGTETCNTEDDNCDGTIDEDFTTAGIYDQLENCGSCGTNCNDFGYSNAQPMCDASGTVPVCDFTCDSGFFDANQDSTDGCECTFISSNDEPFDGVDADCDGSDGDHNQAIHVSATLGNDANDGSLLSPVQTIGTALSLAVTDGKQYVLVAEGSYEESVVLPDELIVYGSMSESFDTRAGNVSSFLIGAEGSPALHVDNITVGAQWSYF